MKVVEIFRSIQGEGRSQGYPSIFLRLAGCNLDCAWCDTRYAREGGFDMPCSEVIHLISALPGKRICITGGEPLLQDEQLLLLAERLCEAGYLIEIETNGTLDFRAYQPFASICMDVKCPSSGEKSDLSLLCHICGKDSVKFVVADREDCRYADEILHSYPVRGEIFFSPVFGSEYGPIADFLIERDIPARLQLQLHKTLGVR
jgi:7-carboxy-7-deazaguanine synthase